MIKSPDLHCEETLSDFDENENEKEYSRADCYKAVTALDEIGSGAYGAVYRSIDLKTNEIVAIKKQENTELVENEIQMLRAACGHPNIIDLLDSFIDDRGFCNLVMPLCDMTLASAITKGMTKEMESIRYFGRQINRGLWHLHKSNIIHRDLKPENILLRLENLSGEEKYVVKLSDFGLANHHRMNRSATTTVVTPPYRAPELCYNAYSSRMVYGTEIDMWSFGCILAEMKLEDFLFPTPASPVVDVIRILGSPPQHLRAIGIDYKGAQLQPEGIHSCFDGHKVTRYFLKLLTEILKWDPRERWSADRTLYHPFFSQPKHDTELEIIDKTVVLPRKFYVNIVDE